MIAKVALRIPHSEPYDYLVPAALAASISIGMRVIVPLRQRHASGVVTAFIDTSPYSTLRPIAQLIDEIPLFSAEMLQFTRWISSYYCCSWGEVLDAAVPSGLNAKFETLIRLDKSCAAWNILPDSEKRILEKLAGSTRPKSIETFSEKETTVFLSKWQKQKIIHWDAALRGQKIKPLEEVILFLNPDAPKKLLRKGSKAAQIIAILAEEKEIPRMELLERIQNAAPPLKKLVKEELVFARSQPVTSISVDTEIPMQPFLELNDEQQEAYASIEYAIQKGGFFTFLLYGVTGSGKTEIYLHAVKKVLSKGKNALILIPEIALTPQVMRRFRSRFGEQVAMLHSGLSDRERFDQWWQIKEGKKSIVLGTRSAIFAPLENIGLVVVDEEHDLSYKQNESPRYHGRDAAIKRAQEEDSVIVLGSATPSAESYYNAEKHKFALLELTKRANQKSLPDTTILDLKETARYSGVFYLSRKLIQRLKENYTLKKQAILFLNRRGYASFLSCTSCELPVLCRSCSISLTWHKTKKELNCHHCGYSQKYPKKCEFCSSTEFKEEGIGTQRVERDLKLIFPYARFLRLDRDTVSKKGELEKKLKLVEDNKVDFIIGTQLISKGHDYPNIGLVCVILADMSLNIPDFRSSEKTFQLLSQVSGRAGRGVTGEGETLVQTYNPDHFAIECAKNHDYKEFIQQEFQQRKVFQNPPFTRAVLLRLSSLQYDLSKKAAFELNHQLLKSLSGAVIQILGPIESPIVKLNNRYYWQILLKSYNGKLLREFCQRFFKENTVWKSQKNVRVTIDVDPYLAI